MAATLTVTSNWVDLPGEGTLTLYTMQWVSHTDGSVASLSTYVPPGRLSYIKVIPASGGTQPTAAFDLTLVDGDGYDLLNGLGIDLINSAPTFIQFDPPIPWKSGNLTPTVANAGSGKAGTFELGVL